MLATGESGSDESPSRGETTAPSRNRRGRLNEEVADPCALCHGGAAPHWYGNIVQVKCLKLPGRHRTRFYTDLRAAVMAWNLNQHHKRNQANKHG